MEIVTGYTGSPHIYAWMDGARNAGTFGEGDYVLATGNQFAATAVSNNEVRLADGDGMMQGRHFTIPAGQTESVTIDTGTAGVKRMDIIAAHYVKDESSKVESIELAVIKGTEGSDYTTPPYIVGNIRNEDTEHYMPLFNVYINGITLENVETAFTLTEGLADSMVSYDEFSASGDYGSIAVRIAKIRNLVILNYSAYVSADDITWKAVSVSIPRKYAKPREGWIDAGVFVDMYMEDRSLVPMSAMVEGGSNSETDGLFTVFTGSTTQKVYTGMRAVGTIMYTV